MDRKSKIREYKDTPRPMGVFQIRNKVNGKVLIGASANLTAILNRFRTELKFGSCRNELLQQEWHQFGADAFEFEALETLSPSDDPAYDPTEDLHCLEELYLEKLKPFGVHGYNNPKV